MSVTVVIGTYGDAARWEALARRALASLERQTRLPDDVLHVHAATLHEARNAGAVEAHTEWLCFLDADDELAPGYVAAMLAVDGDLRYPRVQRVVDGTDVGLPETLGPYDLIEQNYLVIGTFVRRAQFLRVGGFHAWPMYEDWDLWLRCRADGARIVLCRDAIYLAHERAGSRNRQAGLARVVYDAIRTRALAAGGATAP
jgi:glycosyltransferase involved in cell wall biosynthesis